MDYLLKTRGRVENNSYIVKAGDWGEQLALISSGHKAIKLLTQSN